MVAKGRIACEFNPYETFWTASDTSRWSGGAGHDAMKNVIVTRATGMIGSLVLRQCLERSDVANVTSIVRHRGGVEHPKLQEIEHQDFLDFSGITEHFEDQDICFYCLGVYTGQVDPQTFRKITVDFTSAFADALACRSTEVVFCYLSGQGADQTEKSRFMFARDKGAAETNCSVPGSNGRTRSAPVTSIRSSHATSQICPIVSCGSSTNRFQPFIPTSG